MTAAILQGVPATTLDVDVWVDLPPRQYMRMINLAIRLGGTMRSNTIVTLSDETTVNFLYHVDGLRSFSSEYRQCRRMKWLGRSVAVLPLDRIHHSKKTVRRPKDLAQLPYIEQALALQNRLKKPRRA